MICNSKQATTPMSVAMLEIYILTVCLVELVSFDLFHHVLQDHITQLWQEFNNGKAF